MKIGIDAIAFSTSKYVLKLSTLAEKRGVDYAKYCVGIGQTEMSVFPPNEDIVTIAIDAAEKALSAIENKNEIDMVIFATESSFDLSKSAGIYVRHFLGLSDNCRIFDLKQACYSVTAALQLAKAYITCNPNSKVLVIGSDIVKYSKNTSGEPTQGGAAVAIVVSKDPRIAEFEPYSGVYSTEIMDFWRPTYATEALFDGKLSAHNYLKSLDICFERYLTSSKLSEQDIDYACFHAPFCKMARKASKQLFSDKNIDNSLIYNELIGNSCSASLYICLISLLDNTKENMDGKRVGMFSYGSGSVAEYFSLTVSKGYDKMLTAKANREMLSNRTEISFEEYELFRNNQALPGKIYENVGKVTMTGIVNDKREYSVKRI
ncbi:MAG: hydroxymethylglutaryl-CoA synthase [Alphaproteobacteria bacterium]|nr:hydroxymethylglutaryl-CoA synthase [Alphaproteobacteria bacterium]